MPTPYDRMANVLPTDGTQPIPRVGDAFSMQRLSKTRYLEVTSTEWDDKDATLTITMKPILTEEVTLANPDRVIVQDTNPYKQD